jgi:hypothetical protein
MSLTNINLAHPNSSGGLSKPNKWRAAWTNSPTLQEQFPSADSYAEHMAALEREKGAPATASAPMSEPERLAAIDALALPGHEKLVAELKADPSITPGAAALRLVKAEQERRAPAKPSAAVLPFRKFASMADMASEMTAWRNDWRNDAALQREFPSADAYASYSWAIATGRTRGPSDAA